MLYTLKTSIKHVEDLKWIFSSYIICSCQVPTEEKNSLICNTCYTDE